MVSTETRRSFSERAKPYFAKASFILTFFVQMPYRNLILGIFQTERLWIYP